VRKLRPGRKAGSTAGRATRKRVTAKRTTRKKATARKRSTTQRRTSGKTTNIPAEVKKYRDKGMTYREIGDALMTRGIKPQRAKKWNPVVIGRMLSRSAA